MEVFLLTLRVLGQVLFDQFVSDSFGYGDELECFNGLVNAQQQVAGQGVHSHEVVQVSLNCFIKFRDDRLRCIYSLQSCFVFLLLCVEQGKQLELEDLLLPVEIERVIWMHLH